VVEREGRDGGHGARGVSDADCGEPSLGLHGAEEQVIDGRVRGRAHQHPLAARDELADDLDEDGGLAGACRGREG
jgi:hypothetical protein